MLKEYLTSIADSIRAKLGTSEKINAQDYSDKISEVYDVGYAKGAEEGGGGGINPEWTSWRYFSYENNRNSLVAKLKYSDTSNGTFFGWMFYGCSSLTAIPEIDTSNGTDYSSMFYKCTGLQSVPILDMGSAVVCTDMFYLCSNIKKLTFCNWDISQLQKATSLFSSCKILEEINGFEGTLPAISCSSMFSSCFELKEIPNINTQNVTSFDATFNGCKNIQEVSLNTENATNFYLMFQNCESLKNAGTLNCSKATTSTNVYNIFGGCVNLESVIFDGEFPVFGNVNILHQSEKITKESLVSLINALVNKKTTTCKVTIGSTNLAKLTDEQIQIALDKNITLA